MLINLLKVPGIGKKCKREDTVLSVSVKPIRNWFGKDPPQQPCWKSDPDRLRHISPSYLEILIFLLPLLESGTWK